MSAWHALLLGIFIGAAIATVLLGMIRAGALEDEWRAQELVDS